MRQIKFRAFHKIRKEIYQVHCWHSEFVFKDTLDGVGNDGNPDKLVDVELMQLTGLNDKNGNPIYEGDIVKFNGYNCKVIWQFNSCEWMLQQIDTEYKAYMNFEYRYQSDYKIIGNIHENKNLLQ